MQGVYMYLELLVTAHASLLGKPGVYGTQPDSQFLSQQASTPYINNTELATAHLPNPTGS